MSTMTRTELENIIDELHRVAAMNIRLAEQSPKWRRHDARIYTERAEQALQAVQHLTKEL